MTAALSPFVQARETMPDGETIVDANDSAPPALTPPLSAASGGRGVARPHRLCAPRAGGIRGFAGLPIARVSRQRGELRYIRHSIRTPGVAA